VSTKPGELQFFVRSRQSAREVLGPQVRLVLLGSGVALFGTCMGLFVQTYVAHAQLSEARTARLQGEAISELGDVARDAGAVRYSLYRVLSLSLTGDTLGLSKAVYDWREASRKWFAAEPTHHALLAAYSNDVVAASIVDVGHFFASDVQSLGYVAYMQRRRHGPDSTRDRKYIESRLATVDSVNRLLELWERGLAFQIRAGQIAESPALDPLIAQTLQSWEADHSMFRRFTFSKVGILLSVGVGLWLLIGFGVVLKVRPDGHRPTLLAISVVFLGPMARLIISRDATSVGSAEGT